MANVLIIDDDLEMCSMLSELITSVNHHAEYVMTLKKGLDLALTGEFDMVFLDVRMPDGSGLDIIQDILDTQFPPEIIVITGKGDSGDAETAIKKGAWDYIQKPLSPKKIIEPLNRILQYRDGIRSVSKPFNRLEREEIIGSSRQIKECLKLVSKASKSDSNVLITGETGTGKELFARAIHNNSNRCKEKFVVVDCAALTETLVESALFGHEKGSFTGADKKNRGLISLADGGTLFLDEVGEMNLNLQKTFLRVLQEHRFRPLGSKNEEYSDFRVIAATNQIPDHMVKEKSFRADLWYRLNAVPLHLPPLRDRLDDIEVLADSLIERACKRQAIGLKKYSHDFITALKRYQWPGNVRQLVNIIESAVSEAFYEPTLFPKHLPENIRVTLIKSAIIPPGEQTNGPVRVKPVIPDHGLSTYKDIRERAIAKAENSYLRELMKTTRGDIKTACDISDLGRSRLYSLLKKHGIDRMGWG